MPNLKGRVRLESYTEDPNWRNKTIPTQRPIQKTLEAGGMVQQDDYGFLTLRAKGMKLTIPQVLNNGHLSIPHTYRTELEGFLHNLDREDIGGEDDD